MKFDKVWPHICLVGIEILHLSQRMMNSLNFGIQWNSKDSIKFIPRTKHQQEIWSKKFVIPIPSNSFEFRKPNSPLRIITSKNKKYTFDCNLSNLSSKKGDYLLKSRRLILDTDILQDQQIRPSILNSIGSWFNGEFDPLRLWVQTGPV